MGVRWEVDHRSGPAAALHAAWPAVADDPGSRRVAVCRPDRPTVVLGSTQGDSVVDPVRLARSGAVLARRRSGGGAVWVAPDDPAWVDVWIPKDDTLWEDDVTVSFEWVGAAWCRAVEALGVDRATVHRGRPVATTAWADLVCFGGIGAGEVSAPDGRKIVGLAQRRTRHGAWFHGAAYVRWDPRPLVDVLSIADQQRARVLEDLRPAVAGLDGWGAGSGIDLFGALLAALP